MNDNMSRTKFKIFTQETVLKIFISPDTCEG